MRRWPAQAFMAVVRPASVHRKLRLEHRRRPWLLAAAIAPFLVIAMLVPMIGTGRLSLLAGLPPALVARDALQPFRSSSSSRFVPIAQAVRPGFVWIQSPRVLGGWYEARAGSLVGAPLFPVDELAGVRVLPQSLVLAQRSSGEVVGVIAGPGGTVPTAVITILSGPLTVPIRGPVPWFQTGTWFERLTTVAAPIAGIPVLAAASFAVLPVVRRRARVSAGHIVRLLLLGLMLAVPLGLAITGFMAWRELPYGTWVILETGAGSGIDGRLLLRLGLPAVVAAIITFWWMHSAAVHHLRLERPAAVAGATTGVAITGVLTIWLVLMVAS